MISAGARSAVSTTRRRYRIYGLTVESDFELKGLPAAAEEGPAGETLNIVRTPDHSPILADKPPVLFRNEGGEQLFAWATVGAFRIVSGSCIEVDPNEGVADSLVALPLLGSVLATLLHRRGLYVLHASAVSVKGRAVAMLGDKGAGKSTTAAALIGGGHSLLTDDVVAIDFSNADAPVVQPAYGQLKLWDDSNAGLGDVGLVRMGRLHEAVDKANYELAGQFEAQPVPVARIYVLGRSTSPGAEMLAAPDAMAALLRFSYVGRFGEAGFGDGLGRHFQRTAQLVKAGMVRRLDVPLGLDRIAEIPGLVETDLEA